jgi:enamine deaminase RidA (YjgF/YER057c/UK114 family)
MFAKRAFPALSRSMSTLTRVRKSLFITEQTSICCINAFFFLDTNSAPAAIGPYGKKKKKKINEIISSEDTYIVEIAQAIKVNGMVYTSGSLPVVPETGKIASLFS